jgi:uncharacterized protein (TIGR02391 family)
VIAELSGVSEYLDIFRYLVPFESLERASPRLIGLNLLRPLIRYARLHNGRVEASAFVAAAVRTKYFDGSYGTDAAVLLMEGLAYLERAGLIVKAPFHDGYVLTRSGREAAERQDTYTALAGAEEARRLLHPAVAEASEGELERGPQHYDAAVLLAFREIELRLRKITGLETAKFGELIRAAFGSDTGPGLLISAAMDRGELNAIRSLFAGAHGYFRNPAVHRVVGHESADQTIRLLAMSSALLYILDELEAKRMQSHGAS